MGYRIDYSSTDQYEQTGLRRQILTTLMMVLVIMVLLWLQREQSILDADRYFWSHSAECFVSYIQDGERVMDAVKKYCTEVLHEAGIV